MELPHEAPVGGAEALGVRARRDAEQVARVPHGRGRDGRPRRRHPVDLGPLRVARARACRGRARPRRAANVPSPAPSVQKLRRREGHVHERAARRSGRGAEADLRVGELVEGRQAEPELPLHRAKHDVRVHVVLAHEHVSVEPVRRERAQDRAPERPLVDDAVGAQEIRQRRRRAIELHARDAPLEQVHAVEASRRLEQLEHAGRAGAVERAEQVADRRSPKLAGQLHPPRMARRWDLRPLSGDASISRRGPHTNGTEEPGARYPHRVLTLLRRFGRTANRTWRVAPLVPLVLVACSAFGGADDDAPSPTPPDAQVLDDASTPRPTPPDDAAPTDAAATDAAPPTCSDPPAACGSTSCAGAPLRPYLPGVYPFRVVTDATHVFWLEQTQVEGGPFAADGHAIARLVRVAKDGTGFEVMAEDLPRAVGLALDGPNVYWGEANGQPGRLGFVAKTCTATTCEKQFVPGTAPDLPIVLAAAGDGRVVATTGGGALFAVDTTTPGATLTDLGVVTDQYPMLTKHAGSLVAGAQLSATVVQLPRAGGSRPFADIPPLADPQPASRGFGLAAGDCTHLWGLRELPGGNAFDLFRLVPGKAEDLADLPVHRPYGLATDAAWIYVAMPGAGLKGVRKDDPTFTLVPLRSGDIRYLASDDSGLYVSERTAAGGTVTRLTQLRL